MNIGDYKLESDTHNITLSEKRINKKTNTVYFKHIAYFATPQNALKYLVDLELRLDGFKDLETITKKQQELYTLIDSLTVLRGDTINEKGH